MLALQRLDSLQLYRNCLSILPSYASSPTVREYYRLQLLKDCKAKNMSKEHLEAVLKQFDESDMLLKDIVRCQLRATFRNGHEEDVSARLHAGKDQLETIRKQLSSEGIQLPEMR